MFGVNVRYNGVQFVVLQRIINERGKNELATLISIIRFHREGGEGEEEKPGQPWQSRLFNFSLSTRARACSDRYPLSAVKRREEKRDVKIRFPTVGNCVSTGVNSLKCNSVPVIRYVARNN